MEEYFTEEFINYYDNLDKFGKQLASLCLDSNRGYPALDNVTSYNNDEEALKPFDEETKSRLTRYLNELDGTLLVDLFCKELRTHKNFK